MARAEQEAAWKRAAEVKAAHEARLLALSGVWAVGLGPKKRGGDWVGGDDPAIIVFTTHKTGDIAPEQRIPKEIEGIPTDVEERERPRRTACPPPGVQFDTSEYSQLRGGTCIEAKDVINQSGVVTTYTSKGTGGCLAYVGTGPVAQRTVVMLTCYHVVVDTCSFIRTDGGQSVGHPTHYHCSYCSACCTNLIGRVMQLDQGLDIAAIAINGGKEWLAEVQGARKNGDGTFSNVFVRGSENITVVPAGGIHVRKRGMRTGWREGTLRSIGLTVPVDCGPLSSVSVHDAMLIDSIGVDFFSCHGDSGSAILNDDDKVVGILNMGEVPGAHAIHIGAIIAWFAAQNPPLTLEIASATALNQVHTAPEPQGVPAPQERSMVAMGGFGVMPAAFGTRLNEVREELTSTDKGREYATVIERHAVEARSLVNKNKRVATVWHRAGGPQIVQAALAAIQNDDARIPEQIAGKSFRECVRRIAVIFTRYASKPFVDDIVRFEEEVARLGGSTYRDLKAVLA